MSQRTEPTPTGDVPEFSKEYLYSLVGVTALVLLFVYVVMPEIKSPLRMGKGLPMIFPWVIAAGQTIANGLTEFTGNVPGPVDSMYLTASLISLFTVGVLSPTLALLLMRPITRKDQPTGSRALYLVGLIIASTFAFTVVPTGVLGRIVGDRLRTNQSVQENKDRMINDLSMIAMRTREYRVLPKRLGGGGGSIDGFMLAPDLAATDEGSYSVSVAGPDLKVEAVSKRYDGAGMSVMLLSDGLFREWKYTGRFQ